MTPAEHAQHIRQIEFELEKAEHGLAMPYDYSEVFRLRLLLIEARKACANDNAAITGYDVLSDYEEGA